MMIRKRIFEKCGMFNENYISCFEDVEFNLKCEIMGLKNFISGKSVAYHYESQTRNNDEEKDKKMTSDFVERLEPFIRQNFTKLKNIIRFN
jgi:GT2 family glycosyltransferase